MNARKAEVDRYYFHADLFPDKKNSKAPSSAVFLKSTQVTELLICDT